MSVLSVDGFPLSVERIRKSVRCIVDEMEGLIKQLTLSVDLSDAMAYIDSRTDPANPNHWFIDHPREDLQGTSIVSQDPQGLGTFSRKLLERMASDGNYFTKSGGVLVPNKSKYAVTPSNDVLTLSQKRFGNG